jgi:hypothetical protein
MALKYSFLRIHTIFKTIKNVIGMMEKKAPNFLTYLFGVTPPVRCYPLLRYGTLTTPPILWKYVSNLDTVVEIRTESNFLPGIRRKSFVSCATTDFPSLQVSAFDMLLIFNFQYYEVLFILLLRMECCHN